MDIKHVEQAFDQYVSLYDITDVKINLKYIHTKKVADKCKKIAASLNLSQDDIQLCWLIGMLHDIGRFEQLKKYNTFLDSISINHAMFGADLLFNDNMISKFENDTSQYQIIEKSIRYHNRYKLPDDLTDRELLFCQIIRDADKIDIFRANYITGMEDIYNVSTEELKNSSITPAVFEEFNNHHTILRSLNKTIIDHLISHLSLYYGLVYPESRHIAVEQGYLWKLAGFHSDNKDTEKIFNMIRKEHKKEWCPS